MSEKNIEESQTKVEDTSDANATDAGNDKKSPIRLLTLIVFLISILFFAWSVVSDRHTPYTEQARLNALVIPLVPQVSGNLSEVNVRLHSKVKKDDILFEIDKRQFELAVKIAEASVDQASQRMGSQGASVKSATGRLGMAKAQLDRAERNHKRVMQVFKENPEALSMADMDAAETTLASAIEQVSSAEADLEKAQQQLGENGPDNAALRSAITNLEKAQLNLSFATLSAPTDGIIESFNLDNGHYCIAGQPLATFISTNDVWIQADFRENSIENIKIGDEVDFILDVAPGRIFKGKIRSIGSGVSSDQVLDRGKLPDIQSKQGWLRDPQRFPVIVVFNKDEVMKYFRPGGNVDVVVYTGDSYILNSIAKFRVWFNSKISYVR